LLVVVVILGVLAGVVVFAVRGAGDKGRASAYATDAKTLRTAEESFCAKNGFYASTAQQLVDARFLSEVGTMNTVETNGVTGPCGNGTNGPQGFRIVCGTNGSTPPPGCGSGGTIARGGTLVLGSGSAFPATTDPAITNNGSDGEYFGTLYNGLIDLDPSGNPLPELAKEVPTVANGGIVNGGATYILKLRNDVFWHDSGIVEPTNPSGALQQFTGRDVKFSFEKAEFRFHQTTGSMVPFLASWDATNFVASIDVGPCSPCAGGETLADQFSVAFRFTAPYPAFPYSVSVRGGAIVPAHPYVDLGNPNPTLAQLNVNNIGTGPFKCAFPATTPAPCHNGNGSPDALVVRNPNYWQPGVPYADAVVTRALTTSATRYNALLTGAVDSISAPPENVASLQTNGSFTTQNSFSTAGSQNSLGTFYFNLTAWGDRNGQSDFPGATGNPAKNPILGMTTSGNLVRKAVWEAVDRNGYLAAITSGLGLVPTAPISSRLSQHATDISLPTFNVTQAQADLESAGWHDPGPPSNPPATRVWTGPQTPAGCGASAVDICINPGDQLVLPLTIPSTSFNAQAALFFSYMQSVGIKMNSVVVASATVNTNRQWATYIASASQGYDPQVGIPRSYSSFFVRSNGGSNFSGYQNATADSALASGGSTLDPVARFGYYHAWQVQIAQDLPVIWLNESVTYYSWSTKCQGFRVTSGQFAAFASCTR